MKTLFRGKKVKILTADLKKFPVKTLHADTPTKF